MVADIVPLNTNCADIGADHGYLISDLILTSHINKGYACENKVGPYERLVNQIKNLNLNNKIICDLNDGIRNIPEYIDTVVIAGMGGDTVCKIINESIAKLQQIQFFVISSHSKMNEVRLLLNNLGYYIKDENACFDSDIYYEVSLFEKGSKSYSEIELNYGPILIKNKNIQTKKYLQNRLNFNEKLMQNDNLPTIRIEQIKNENYELNSILCLFK